MASSSLPYLPSRKTFSRLNTACRMKAWNHGGSSVRESEPLMDWRLTLALRHRTIVGGVALVGALLGALFAEAVNPESFKSQAHVAVPADTGGLAGASPLEAYVSALTSDRVVGAVAAETGVSVKQVLEGVAVEPSAAMDSLTITWVGDDGTDAAEVAESLTRHALEDYFYLAVTSAAVQAEPARVAVRNATATLEATGWTPEDAEQVVRLRAAAAALDAQTTLEQADGPSSTVAPADPVARAREAFLVDAGGHARATLAALEGSLATNRPLLDVLEQAEAQLAPLAAREAGLLGSRSAALSSVRLVVSQEVPGSWASAITLFAALVWAILCGAMAMIGLQPVSAQHLGDRLARVASAGVAKRIAFPPLRKPVAAPMFKKAILEFARVGKKDVRPKADFAPLVPALPPAPTVSSDGARNDFALGWELLDRNDQGEDAFEQAWERFWGHGAGLAFPDRWEFVLDDQHHNQRVNIPIRGPETTGVALALLTIPGSWPDAPWRPDLMSCGSSAVVKPQLSEPAGIPDVEASWPPAPWRASSRHDLDRQSSPLESTSTWLCRSRSLEQ